MTKPRVKPLEWVKHPTKDIWRAIVGFGVYKVFGITFPSWDFDSWSDGKDKISQSAPTIEAAKASAQADYEARILAALDMTPDPAVQALVEAASVLAKMADRYDPREGDDDDLECWSRVATPKIGHLRNLRAALAAFDKT